MADQKKRRVPPTGEKNAAEIIAYALDGVAHQLKDLGMGNSTGNPLGGGMSPSWGAIETLCYEVKGVGKAIDHLARAVLVAAGKSPDEADGE